MSQFPSSLPGIGATGLTFSPRHLFIMPTQSGLDFLPGGKIISGAATRDPDNSAVRVDEIRPGLLLGKITASGLLAAAIIGVSVNALTSTGTTVTLSAAQATELVRRNGSTGTFILTGPPTAAGTVRSMTATYSAVNTSTGAVTISALGVNEVQTVNFNIASTGGTVTLLVPKVDGTLVQTTPISWSATDATYLASINSALDTATGVAGGIVATAIAATDTDLGFVLTFSGTGYARLPAPAIVRVVGTLPTSSTSVNVVRTTAGVDGRFIAGAIVGAGDGSEVPTTFLASDTPIRVTDVNGTSQDTPNALIPITSKPVYTTNIVNYPSDSSLKAYIKSKLRTLVPAMTFDDDF